MTPSMSDDLKDTVRATPEIKSVPTERLMLIGRDRELAQVGAILKLRRPALVVVSAVTGMGKTSLLRVIEARAIEQGWHTVYSDSEVELSVVPSTTEETFRSQVLTLLGASTEDSFVDTITDRSRSRSLHRLAKLLRHRAPVLLVIDGYRPEPGFANWFANHFIEDIKDGGSPVVIIVADQAGSVERLQSFADEIITLGPLDRQAVKEHFELVRQQITPPIMAAELDAYVEAACKDPVRLPILTRVLALAQPGEGTTDLSTPTHGVN
jgi:hypothetical protein